MTYDEFREKMPEESRAREQNKLAYRYPRGESYIDLTRRLEPVSLGSVWQLRLLFVYVMDHDRS